MIERSLGLWLNGLVHLRQWAMESKNKRQEAQPKSKRPKGKWPKDKTKNKMKTK